MRAIAGLQGAIRGFDYEIAVNYTANRQVDRLISGWLSETAFARLVQSGVVNPFGPNTTAALAEMRGTQVSGQANDNQGSDYGGDAKISGAVYAMPAGPLVIALGAEGHRESLSQANSEFLVSGESIVAPSVGW